MKNKNTEKIEFLKIVYFDEAAAQDYVDVTNGGRLDWSTQENKEKIAKIVAEIEALICPLSSRQVKYLKVSDKNTYISFWSVGIFMHTISLYIF